ncbi:DUF1444 domain-containing protein [Domibacillus epiphyticus]|uniref:UPF0354 protein BTO28_05625 n=1 Tax=Domibacillus epiphyticus TaxID=1714355 RepID=A0A1V2A8Z3_9BACI|nr:DUF1444 domain-containing protein [Domibacillus epiphyticus]OMP67427.1 DUF1444 domain-containing protein [Domibacillus epiphyticus]
MSIMKLKKKLEEALKKENRTIAFDREKEEMRVENSNTKKGVTVALGGILAKFEGNVDKAAEETIYYINEALNAFDGSGGKEEEKRFFPVIRAASFPVEAEEGVPLFYDDHTAETRIYYAVDLGSTYRLIDKKFMQKENWTAEQIREIARFNLRSLPLEMKQDTVAGNIFYFLNSNDGYDSSRILNDRFLKEMSERVEGDMTVSVPHGDVLIIGDIRNETGYDILAQMAMSFFAAGRVPITALSFIYEDGHLEPVFIMAKNRPQKG